MNVALVDFVPRFCPSCGARLHELLARLPEANFNLRRAFSCSACGTLLQRAKRSAILAASVDSEGNLAELSSGSPDPVPLELMRLARSG